MPITFAVIKIEAMSDDELKKKLESMTCEFRSGPTPSGGAFMIGYARARNARNARQNISISLNMIGMAIRFMSAKGNIEDVRSLMVSRKVRMCRDLILY